ncbi:MAG: L,D-transpeptidase family protein [Xanthobacteraceae bacterium]
MNSSQRVSRFSIAAVVIAAAIALGGCDTDSVNQLSGRALAPLSQDMQAEIAKKDMPMSSPILVRIFKEEAELEVWKQDNTGKFALLKAYPICRWSGDLGPKVKEGDRQAPEGFYQITPGLMNPNSNYYLAFNLGFPNTYDKANDRTGAFLMVHGDCSSRGCYAMTDEQITEIFALGRESFQGGQKSFQVQAYPFHMTPLNMAKHRNSPHMAFWRMIKQGYDHFEVTRQEPRVDVCDKHYVFDAESRNGAPLNFNSRGRCPAYQLGPEVAQAIKAKQAQDEQQFAAYVARNTPTVPFKNGVDGGMHPTFIAKLKPKRLLDGVFAEKIVGAQPGAMGNNVNPPADVDVADGVTASVANRASVQSAAYQPAVEPEKPAPASAPASAAQPSAWAKMGQFLGVRSADATPSVPPPQPKASAPATAAPAKPVADGKPKAPVPAPKPVQAQQRQQVAQVPPAQAEEPAPAATPGVINGAAPPVPASSFNSRWGAAR